MKIQMINQLKKRIQEMDRNKLYLCFTVLIALIYCTVASTRTMPYAEGWYSYYAKLINDGQKAYVDFEYLFWPLYINVIAFITKIFGYELIVLRIMGILLFTALSAISYRTFCKIFSPLAALMGSTVAVMYLQSEVVQIFYDYIRLMDLFVYLLLLNMVNYVYTLSRKNYSKSLLYAILSGVFLGGFVLTKQNMGLLFFAYFVGLQLFYLYYFEEKKIVLKYASISIVTVLVTVAAIIMLFIPFGSIGDFLNMTTVGASSAKGGMVTILFGWIINGVYLFKEGMILVVIVGEFVLINWLLNKYEPQDIAESKKKRWGYIFGIGMILGLVVSLLIPVVASEIGERTQVSPYSIYIAMCLIMGILFLYMIWSKMYKKNIKSNVMVIFMLAGSMFAVGYGCGTSGGIAQSQMGFGLGLIVALIVDFIKNKYQIYSMTIVVVSVMVIGLTCGCYKYMNPYTWWGMTEPDIWQCTEYTDIDELKGIKVSENTKYIYEDIVHTIQEETEEDEQIFTFPNIPIFYVLADRYDVGTYAKVHWFDVATDKSILADIDVLKENPPEAMVIYNMPEWAMENHEILFRGGEKSATRTMQEFLYEYADDNGYYEHDTYVINEETSITLMIKK